MITIFFLLFRGACATLIVGRILFDFNKDVFYYEVTVLSEVNELEINAKTEDSKATVKGNGIYKLEVGNNLIKLDATAENGNVKEYTINVLRKESVNDDDFPEDSANEKTEKTDNSNKKVVHLSKYLEVLFGVVVLIVSFGIYIIKKRK